MDVGVRAAESNLRKSSLQRQYQSVCERQQQSTVRNEALLQDLQRLKHQMSISTVPTTQLKSLKHQYEEYILALYPQWLAEVQACRAAQSDSSNSPKKNVQPLGNHGYNLSKEGSWPSSTTTVSAQRIGGLVNTYGEETRTRTVSAVTYTPKVNDHPGVTCNHVTSGPEHETSQLSKPAATKFLQPDQLIPNSAMRKPPISKPLSGLKPSRIPKLSSRIQHKSPLAASDNSKLQPPKHVTATAKRIHPTTPYETGIPTITKLQQLPPSSGEDGPTVALRELSSNSSKEPNVRLSEPNPVTEVRLLEETNGEILRPASTDPVQLLEHLSFSSLSACSQDSLPDEPPIRTPSSAPETPSPSHSSSSLHENGTPLPSGNDPLPPSGHDLLPPSGDEQQGTPPGNDPLPPSGDESLPPSGDEPIPPSGDESLPPSGHEPLPPSGNYSLSPSGNDPLPPSGDDPLPPLGDGLLSPSGDEQQGKASSSEVQYKDSHSPKINLKMPEHSLEHSEVSPPPWDGASESAYQFLAQSMLPEDESNSLLSEGSAVAELEKELQAGTTIEGDTPLSTRSKPLTPKSPLIFPSPPDGSNDSSSSSSHPFSPAYVPTAIEQKRTSTELRKKLGFWGDSESEVELSAVIPLNEDKEDFDFYG